MSKSPIKFSLSETLLLSVIFTGLCVFSERTRTTERHAEIAAESADSLRLAAAETTRLLWDFIAQTDRIPLERFDEIAGKDSPENARYFEKASVGFSFCRSRTSDPEQSATRAGTIYGMPGLETKTVPRESKRNSPEPSLFFDAEECAALILEIVGFVDFSDKTDRESWKSLFGGQIFQNYPAGTRRWLSVFHGSVPDLKPCFSGGFYFVRDKENLFMVRKVRGPEIDFCIQGMRMNCGELLAGIGKRLQKRSRTFAWIWRKRTKRQISNSEPCF